MTFTISKLSCLSKVSPHNQLNAFLSEHCTLSPHLCNFGGNYLTTSAVLNYLTTGLDNEEHRASLRDLSKVFADHS